MLKSKAIELLGGTPLSAAHAIGVTTQAISQWPDELPQRIADRVQAALWRLAQQNDHGVRDVVTEPVAGE